jgi:hypothetical protein
MAVSKEWKSAYDRQRYLKNRADPQWVAREKQRLANLSDETKARRRAYEKAYREAHREESRAYAKTQRARNYYNDWRRAKAATDPAAWRRGQHAVRIKSRFKLTREQYDALLESQGGVCAICKKPEWVTYRGTLAMLSVDHDRACCPTKSSCGKCVRALLCSRCNTTLGQVNDSPELLRAMIAYLG